jgi:ABC-2 type transport system ATP-binding protein
MWDQIAALAAEQDKTVLLTTHYLEEADQLAARLAIVDRGKVVAEGTPEELKSELRGDAIHVELAEAASNGSVAQALEQVAGVHEISVEGRALRARAEDGGRAVPTVLQALEAHGIEVAAVRVARPSLDDVYLRYTGRTFQEAESEQEAQSKEEAKR